MLRSIVRGVAALIAAASLSAQQPPQVNGPIPATPYVPQNVLSSPGRDVTVSLLTMGNGEQIWELFGHAAFWIHDARTGADTVINWGVFDAHQPLFIPHFLEGLMLYRMGGDPIGQVIYAYRYFNRTVWSQELELTATQKDSMLAIIRENGKPENVTYRYDYFVDNCATKPRDILNRVLNGQLRIGADSVTNHSYRWHTLRLMQHDEPVVLGVHIGLGEPADRPITRWEEMFLPRELHDWVATRQVRDSAGVLHPLVRGERVLFQSSRPPEPTTAPSFAWLWIVGVGVAALLAWLGVSAVRRATPGGVRTAAAIAFSTWAALCGLLGLVLTLLWTITDHRFAHANENLLLFNPLWLVLAVLLPMYLLRGKAPRTTRGFVRAVTVCALIALIAHGIRLSHQDNLTVIGLALPAALVTAYVFTALPRPLTISGAEARRLETVQPSTLR